MKTCFLFVAAILALTACEQTAWTISMKNPGVAEIDTCAVPSAPSCRFRNSPVQMEQQAVRLPGRDLPFYPTAQELEFLDAVGRSWVAPRRTLTDGASIPRMFVSIIGNPTSREFANAAALHDAYCGVGNEDGLKFQTVGWRSVHRMFYDALRVGGTPEIKAKIMFAAVYIGGPRWDWQRREGDSVARDATGGLTLLARWTGARSKRDAEVSAQGNVGLSPAAMRQVLRRTIGYIEADNPTLPQIEEFAEAGLGLAQSQAQGPGGSDGRSQGGTSVADPAIGGPATETPATETPATGTPAGDPATAAPTAGDPAVGNPATGPATATTATAAPGVDGVTGQI